jgi:hypothetical protein
VTVLEANTIAAAEASAVKRVIILLMTAVL